jgi:AcrR family transcriptional regulator
MPETDRRLPSGRRPATGLTKDDVTQIQRDRMLFAMAEAIADEGYAGVSVTHVVTRAGVSRATFYEQFADKQDCFLSAFDRAAELLSASLLPHLPGGRDPKAFPRLLSRYLDALIDHEAFARVFLIDVYAAGPAGFRRRAASQQRFAEVLGSLFGVRTAKDRFACEALVAAIGSMVTTKLAERDLDGLRALHGPITRLATSLFT